MLDWELLAAIGTEHHRTERVLMWYDAGDISLSVAKCLLRGAHYCPDEWWEYVQGARGDHETRKRPTSEQLGDFFKEHYGPLVGGRVTYAGTPRSEKSAFVEATAAWIPPSPDPAGPFFGVDRGESLKSGVALKLEAEARARAATAGPSHRDGETLKPITGSSEPSAVQTTDTPSDPAEASQQPHRASKQGPCCPNCGKTAAPEHITPLQNSHAVSVQCWWCENRWEERP